MTVQTPWLRPGIWGGIIGAVVTMIVGFSWLGWTLGGTAERMAVERSNTAVVVALTPSCVSRFLQQPGAAVKLKALREADTWKQQELVAEGGWATAAGTTTPNTDLARACAEELVKTRT